MTMRKFLIADDDADFRSLMSQVIDTIFEGDEITYGYADNGKEAIDLFDEAIKAESPFDIIVTDFIMPEMSGNRVIDHVMNSHPVPIVVVSAFPEALDRDFIQDGAIYFMHKPFKVEVAREAFNAAIALKILPEDIKKAHEAIERLDTLNI